MTEAEPEEVEEELVEAKLAPELPPAPNPVAVLAPPPKPKPKPVKKVVKKVHKPDHKPPAPKTTAPARTQARQAATSAAPREGAAGSSMSSADWRNQVRAQLNRHKPSLAPGDGQGTVMVIFTINRGGHVMSSRVTRSSGSATLDQKALQMIQRSNPLPPPPADIRGNAIALPVPVRFSQR
jgi:protein TonB